MILEKRQIFVLFLALLLHQILAKTVYFKIEHSSFCSTASTLLKPSKNTTFKITRHNLSIIGNFDLLENIRSPIELHINTSKCSLKTSKCRYYNYSRVPGLCSFFERIPFSKHGLGDYITPPMRCPLKKGSYSADVVINIEQFGYLPIDTSVKYQEKMLLFEITGKKNRLIACLDANVRAMQSSSRKILNNNAKN